MKKAYFTQEPPSLKGTNQFLDDIYLIRLLKSIVPQAYYCELEKVTIFISMYVEVEVLTLYRI